MNLNAKLISKDEDLKSEKESLELTKKQFAQRFIEKQL